ncbi:MAG TPA: hypothetical protein VKA10_01375 [Prolixibacteraceae bacterium]|nr:hypothetical protein [Prolixibacteraceae bacterium]
MEFKKLDIQSDESWLKRTVWTPHGKKTILYILLGALAGFIIFMLTEDKQFANLTWGEVLPNIALGAFFGFFITNSPCARNKC